MNLDIPLSDFWLDRLTNLVPAHRWSGLSEECCRALNLPLSTANLAAANRSLHWTFVQRYPEGLPGGINEQYGVEWFTFARKVLEDLKRDSALMQQVIPLNLLNFPLSSLTLRIFANRRMPLPSTEPF